MKFEEITRKDYMAYERIRNSGITNMFDINYVSVLSGLDKNKVIAIIKNYSRLMKKYPDVRK